MSKHNLMESIILFFDKNMFAHEDMLRPISRVKGFGKSYINYVKYIIKYT